MIGLPTVEQMMVPGEASLRDALAVIDSNTQGVGFIVDDGRVLGVLSDGDIRRALMRGVQLDAPVQVVMQREFVSLPVNTPLDQIQAHLNASIRHIPIVDESGRLVDYACASRYHQVPLIQPVLNGNELEYVSDCIRTGWISSQGKYVRLFEEKFGQFVGGTHALAVANGTVALHLVLATLGVGPGDEVIVPDLTFAAPANAVLYVGATPVFVDVDPFTMAMNVEQTEQAITGRTRAIIPVHLYGHPADMAALMTVARRHDLLVVEDCAEALGSRFGHAHVGTFGDAATFSFYGNKTITTGEGGMVLFREDAMHERARMLRDHGMSRERRYWHDVVGYNYRLTNLQAAIGVAQLERAAGFVASKRWIAEQYRNGLSEIPGIRLPGELGDAVNSYWLYTLVLPQQFASKRDETLHLLAKNGVEVRPVFFPLHRMPPYAPFVPAGRNFPVSDSIADAGISLPSGVTTNETDIAKVCLLLTQVLAEYGACEPVVR